MEQDNVLQAAVALALFYEPINNSVSCKQRHRHMTAYLVAVALTH